MVGKIFASLLGLALINFVLFAVCFFWAEISTVIITPQGMFLAFLLAVGLAISLAVIHYIEYRKKEVFRKQRIRQKVDAFQKKDVGIDF
jgi:hypothetical protein